MRQVFPAEEAAFKKKKKKKEGKKSRGERETMFFLVLYFLHPWFWIQSFSSALRGQQVQLLSLILFNPLNIRGLKNDKFCTLGFPFPRLSNFSLSRLFFKLLDSVYALAPTPTPTNMHTHTHTHIMHTQAKRACGSLVSEWKSFSHVRLFAIPWTIQSMEFSRPEYWSG